MGERRPALRSRMVVRLWAIMMALVLFGVLFMWVVQIFLFERNYIDAAIADARERLESVMEDLKTEDLAYNDKLIPYLSKSTSGKIMLVDTSGELLALYSYGHPVELQIAENESAVWHSIRDSEEYRGILEGEQYKKIIRDESSRTVAFEIGVPATYAGQRVYVILYHSLDEVQTALAINRRQLVVISVILTLAASVLAAVLSRRFVRPIQKIRGAVNRMAGGDLAATPGLHLRDELGELSHSVEELGQALQRVEVLRKEVIANVSHELRSPLSLIAGYAEMVRDISWSDEEKRGENLNLIIREARRMSEMVSDIMDYSQFQAGYVQLKLDSYNLCDIVESEVAHCEQSAADHRIAIRLECDRADLPVRVDALKLSQVMRNLLYNAINHTGDGETVTIRVAVEPKGARARVAVINPGEPIPEAERALIWERYHRSQHQGGRKQGTGLGLSIVSTILGAHGMPYGVDCADGKTIFWFACPLER